MRWLINKPRDRDGVLPSNFALAKTANEVFHALAKLRIQSSRTLFPEVSLEYDPSPKENQSFV